MIKLRREAEVGRTFILPYPPSSNHFHTIARGRKILSSAGRQYFKDVADENASGNRPVITGPVSVAIAAYRPRKTGDLDNLIKPILDSLKYAGIYADDKQVVAIHAGRYDDKKRPRVEVTITELESE